MPERWKDPRVWALAVPAVVVVGLLVWALMPYTGQAVLLETRPRDPTDVMRGDYQTLRYKVGGLNESVPGVTSLGPVPTGTTLYVTLVPGLVASPSGKPYWTAAAVGRSYVPKDGGVCIRGTVSASGNGLSLDYGIEAYFVQKDADLSAWNHAKVSVVAKVRDCTARIAEVQLDGQTWDG